MSIKSEIDELMQKDGVLFEVAEKVGVGKQENQEKTLIARLQNLLREQ